MPKNKPWLIIAESARALAASAVKAGFTCHVIDRFNDADTASLSLSRQRLPIGHPGFEAEQLSQALASFQQTQLAGIVIGGGLEQFPDCLETFSRQGLLLTNSATTVNDCKLPERFFPLLDELGIPHPEVALHEIRTKGHWLLKKTGAAGGGHIKTYKQGEPIEQGHYLQERIMGRAFSLVFLADGIKAQRVGISETWCMNTAADDFRYRGAVSLGESETSLLAPFDKLISILADKLRLRGLCGLDVIVDEKGQINLLEINPRPTATFSLHEGDISLFAAHIKACLGEFIPLDKPTTYRAHEIIYNLRNGAVPEMTWPEWVTDRPAAGEAVLADEPLCTIHAETESLAATKAQLAERVNWFLQQPGLHQQAA